MDGAFAMPRQARVFETSLHSTSRNTAGFDILIREQLNQVTQDFNTMDTDSPPTPPHASEPGLLSQESATLLRELGDYFTRTAQMWSTMTHNLLQGPHIDKVTTDVNTRSQVHSRLTDFSAVAAVDVEIGRLRKIRDLTAKFSQDVQAVWRPEGSPSDPSSTNQFIRSSQLPLVQPFPPVPNHATHGVTPGYQNGGSMVSVSSTMSDHGDTANDDGSDSGSDDEELFAHINMEALKQRGKGMYTCPKGEKCDKGGVDKAGNIVHFDRNSSFAQHCNKHRKPWVCDLEHCPNTPKKRRFARRDGLERHKQTVKHEPKNADSSISVR